MDPPGFKRCEVEGKRPFYVSIPEVPGEMPVQLHSLAKVKSYLERNPNRSVALEAFDFGKKRKISSPNQGTKEKRWSAVFSDPDDDPVDGADDSLGDGAGGDPGGKAGTSNQSGSRFNLENLMKAGAKLNHEKILKDAATMLDMLYLGGGQSDIDDGNLAEIKWQLQQAGSLGEMVQVLATHDAAMKEMAALVHEHCLEELLSLGSVEGPLPLADWPNNCSSNWFSDVANFAAAHSPVTLSFLLRLTLKEMDVNVLPMHVVTISTIYAQLAQQVDKANNVLTKIQALSLKMSGTTDEGLDGQAKMGLCQTARNLRKKRDEFAEVQRNILLEGTSKMPSQYTIDNCDMKGHSCTVEYLQVETVSTAHLSSEAMSKEDTLRLFTPDILLLNRPELKGEQDQLRGVVLLAVGRDLAKHLDIVSHWAKVLPKHHQHPYSHLPVVAANAILRDPRYFKVKHLKWLQVFELQIGPCTHLLISPSFNFFHLAGDRAQGNDPDVPQHPG